MMRFPAVLALVLVPALASAEVRVQVQAGRLDVTARAPLSEILDRIARQTGMKVVYDGAPPRQVVAAEYRGVAPARAVIGMLQGQNLNFAAITDPTGQQVTTLMVLGPGARPGAAAPMAAAAPQFPPVSTGFDPSDAEINNGEEIPEEELDQFVADDGAVEAEPEPAAEEVKKEAPANAAAPAPFPGAWPGNAPGPLVPFSPIPAPNQQPAEAELNEPDTEVE